MQVRYLTILFLKPKNKHFSFFKNDNKIKFKTYFCNTIRINMKGKILVFLMLFIGVFAFAQNNPKIEMRAVWLATVANLDWPNSYDKNNVEAQKSSFIDLIESLQEVNINTIFFQVRTECDALYDSKYEPWSRYLTGTQGKYPGFDPLQFAIEVCHERGMELHAWLNPYRINTSNLDNGNYYDSQHIYRKHPGWVIIYDDGKKILNPGLPKVQKYIKQVVGDLIGKYDIDGIHFDDYFYAYGGTSVTLDAQAYNEYGSEYTNIGDFRRGSINKMIAGVKDTIEKTKPYLRFGVSPFGIYGNGKNPPGISGLNAYDVIYCDPLAWLKEGTVDYINPQLYWPTGGNQDFGKLLPWWANYAKQYNRDVYAGQAIYRLDDNPAASLLDFGGILHEYKDYFNFSEKEIFRSAGWSLEEIVRQIEIVRSNSNKNALGSVFFRAKDFNRVANLKSYLYNNVYKYKTLLPEQYWKASTKPDEVTNIRFKKVKGESFYGLFWDNADTLNRYAIYNTTNTDYLKSENLLDVSFNNFYIPPIDSIYSNISISIVKINRFWQVGDPSESYSIPKPEKPVLILPENNYLTLSREDLFSWNSSKNSSLYKIEFSNNSSFSSITNSYKLRDTFLNANSLQLEGGKEYFWRVKSANIGGYSVYSEIRKFTPGFPKTPLFIYPVNNEKDVPLTLEFEFDISDNSDSLHLQLSRGGSEFSELRLEIDTIIPANHKFKLNSKLQKFTTYYSRVKTINDYGNSDWSEIIKFKTLMPVPSKTKITEPKDNTGLNESVNKVEFKWNEASEAAYYLFQISEKNDFSTFVKNDNVYAGTKYTYHNPPKKKWMFARVAGKNIGGIAEWSESIHFVLDNTVDIDELNNLKNEIYLFPNPCEDSFSINFAKTNDYSNISIEVFDISGKELSDMNVVALPESKVITLDIEQFVCTPCFIRVTTGNKTNTLKLFKYK